MALDKATMEFCIKNCTDAVANAEQFVGLDTFARGQSKMAESLANQLQEALDADQAQAASAAAGSVPQSTTGQADAV